MRIQQIQPFNNFLGIPKNFGIVDSNISRSAQPEKNDFIWLREQGVTDIINFRTMFITGLAFDEAEEVRRLGMEYHPIPTVTREPSDTTVLAVLALITKIKNAGGKIHMHCKAGADRTGMYAFIYKCLKGIGSMAENEKEWLNYGHNTKRYPNLINWAKNFVNKATRLK